MILLKDVKKRKLLKYGEEPPTASLKRDNLVKKGKGTETVIIPLRLWSDLWRARCGIVLYEGKRMSEIGSQYHDL